MELPSCRHHAAEQLTPFQTVLQRGTGRLGRGWSVLIIIYIRCSAVRITQPEQWASAIHLSGGEIWLKHKPSSKSRSTYAQQWGTRIFLSDWAGDPALAQGRWDKLQPSRRPCTGLHPPVEGDPATNLHHHTYFHLPAFRQGRIWSLKHILNTDTQPSGVSGCEVGDVASEVGAHHRIRHAAITTWSAI